jgi:hypothetical protein
MSLWKWQEIQEMLWQGCLKTNEIHLKGSDLMIDLYEYKEKLKFFTKTIEEVGVSL